MLTVQTGARLHFGLLAFGEVPLTDPNEVIPARLQRRFGGVGLMVDRPFTRLQFRKSTASSVEFSDQITVDRREHLEQRIRGICQAWRTWHSPERGKSPSSDLHPVAIRVSHALPSHSGFGSGTQLACAVVQGLQSIHRLPNLAPQQISQITSRGLRSAIGTYGFEQGGFLVDEGKLPGEPIAPAPRQFALPDDWHFVTAMLRGVPRMHGAKERSMFAQVPPVPLQTTRELWGEIENELLPAIELSQFDRFAASLWRYGKLAGECFASVQGGSFHGERVGRLVSAIRSHGLVGVGQSSWGPAIFVAVESLQEATELSQSLIPHLIQEPADIWISRPLRQGAQVLETSSPRR